jgi:hypothetical protein
MNEGQPGGGTSILMPLSQEMLKCRAGSCPAHARWTLRYLSTIRILPPSPEPERETVDDF